MFLHRSGEIPLRSAEITQTLQHSSYSLCRFVCQKGIAKHLKQPGFAFPAGTAKGVNRRADPDIDKTALLKHMPPACTRQATGNSVGPQVDIAEGACWNLLAVRDVGKLQASTRPQNTQDFSKDLTLVGAQVDDAVADYDID